MEPRDALPFVVAIAAAVGGLALASHGPATYQVGLAIFVLATGYGYWSEKLYFDRRERCRAGGTMPDRTAPQLTMTRAEFFQMYGEAGQYDRHYSTVRATVCVFLLTAAVALSAYILQASPRPVPQGISGHTAAALPDWVSWVIVVLVVLLLGLANLVNVYFQRCSHACQKLQRSAEELISTIPATGAAAPTAETIAFAGFRTGFKSEYDSGKFSIAEPISKFLVAGSTFYLLGMVVAIFVKLHL